MKFWEENLKFLKLDKRDLNDIFYTCTKKKKIEKKAYCTKSILAVELKGAI